LNRETRRKLKITKEQADVLERLRKNREDEHVFKDGEKVKLNYEQIVKRNDWEKLNQKYKKFVEESKDSILTIQIDEIVHNKYKLISFKEDTMEPKFLFWVGDLLILKD